MTVEIPDGETLLRGRDERRGRRAGRLRAAAGTCGKCLVRTGAGELQRAHRGRAPQGAGRASSPRAGAWPARPRRSSERVSIEVRATQGRRQILTTSRLHPGEPHPAVVREVVAPRAADARRRACRPRAAAPPRWAPTACRSACCAAAARRCATAAFAALVTRYDGRPIDVESRTSSGRAYGAAVDIGTSKIIAYLFDLRERPADRSGGAREPPDALRRRRRHAHHAGHRRRATWTSCAARPASGVNDDCWPGCARVRGSPRAISTT